jgi:hypothetical protein
MRLFLCGHCRFALDKTYFDRINGIEVDEQRDCVTLLIDFFSVILLRLFVRRSPKTSKGKGKILLEIREESLFYLISNA